MLSCPLLTARPPLPPCVPPASASHLGPPWRERAPPDEAMGHLHTAMRGERGRALPGPEASLGGRPLGPSVLVETPCALRGLGGMAGSSGTLEPPGDFCRGGLTLVSRSRGPSVDGQGVPYCRNSIGSDLGSLKMCGGAGWGGAGVRVR